MSQHYPLAWPNGWDRTKSPGSSKFKTQLSTAINNVNKSLSLFGSDTGKKIIDIVISSNYTLGDQRPKDAGVALYFTWDNIQSCIAVDRYAKIEDNLQAIHHIIEAERVKYRHGGLNIIRATLNAYAGLPPPHKVKTENSPNWWEVLGVSSSAARWEIDAAYKSKRSATHPDRPGGSAEKFNLVQTAYNQAINQQ